MKGKGFESVGAEAEAEKLIAQTITDVCRFLNAPHLIDEITWEWNSRLGKKVFGRANLEKNLIQINPRVLEHFNQLESTLKHEICHLIAWDQDQDNGHGFAWMKLMQRLGLSTSSRSPDRHNVLRTHPPHWKRRT